MTVAFLHWASTVHHCIVNVLPMNGLAPTIMTPGLLLCVFHSRTAINLFANFAATSGGFTGWDVRNVGASVLSETRPMKVTTETS